MLKMFFFTLISIIFSSLSWANCTLNRPGPFLIDPSDGRYTVKNSEDSSQERLKLSEGQYLIVSTFGCEDSWGWEIRIEIDDAKMVPSLQSAQKRILEMLSYFKTSKIDNYQLKEKITIFETTKAVQKEVVCNRKTILSPKECAETLELEIKTQAKKQIINLKFQDLEN
jgi:hypothetical protein